MSISNRSPIGRAVSNYLRDSHPAGLNVSEIYERLVSDLNFGGTKQLIVDLLTGNPEVYAKGSAGHWLDAMLVAADGGRVAGRDQYTPLPDTIPVQVVLAPDHHRQFPGRFANSYVVFDLETLIGEAQEQRRIIEISALKFVDGAQIGRFQKFVDPGEEIDAGTENLTRISNVMVGNAPTIDAVLPEFTVFIEDLPLVAHNGRSFDLPLLNYWARVYELPEITNNIIDTLELALFAFPTEPILNQGRVNELLGLAPYAAHRAEADVTALADVFSELLKRLASTSRKVRQAINRFYAPFVLCDDQSESTPKSAPARTWAPVSSTIDAAHYASAPGVRSIFAADGLLAEQYGHGYEDRPSQTDMADLTWQAFSAGQYWLIEAPTGTGKTNAYLYPASVWALTTGHRVFISVHTRQLQEQIREAIERAQSFGFPVRHAVLKGRHNYVCWARWQHLVEGTNDHLLRAFLLAWREHTREGLLDEFPPALKHRIIGGDQAFDRLLEQIYADPEVCDNHHADHATCPYHTALSRAWNAHLVVVNHALLLTANWGTQNRPSVDYLVCDEAHNLEDAATLALEGKLTDRSFDSFVDLAEADHLASFRDRPYFAVGYQQLQRQSNQLRFHLQAFGESLTDHVRQQTYESETDERYPVRYRLQWGDIVRDSKGRWSPVRSASDQVLQQLHGMSGQLAELIDRAGAELMADRDALSEVRALARRLNDIIDLLDDILHVGNANNVYWIELPAANEENPNYRWALHRAPIKLGWFLRKKVYEQARAIVFTSATLTVDQSFDYFLNRLGLDHPPYDQKTRVRPLPSVFQTKADILFAVPQNVGRYHPNRFDEFVERASQEIHQLLHLQPKRSLLLFTARHRMNAIFRRTLRPLMRIGLEPAEQGTGGLLANVDELRRNDRRVQFGVKAMWEGVDVPGMSYVMIEKLPFPLFFDPVVAARMERAKKDTGSDFYGYYLPEMVIRFKQGFGRLYRRNGDHGVVVLLDRALRRATYRDTVMRSLPAHTYTSESGQPLYQQIKEFFGGTLTDADLLVQRTEFEKLLEEYTLRQLTFSAQEYQRIRPKLLAGLNAFFDFPQFVGRQEEIIRAVLGGQDTLGVLPTGAGKSLTFQLPAILRDGLTVVVSPLIALMKDQVDKLRDDKGIRCADYIVSGQSAGDQDEILQRMVDGQLRLVYVSPERFRDKRLYEALSHCKVIQFVVDEAHCVSMWGHDFRPDFLYVHEAVERLGRPPLLALTATATPEVKADIKTQLHMQVARRHEIIDSFDRPNLRFVVQPCRSEAEKERWLMRLLYRSREPAIVYVATRRDADLIASMLRDRGIAARAYHAGMERFDRDVVQDMFMADQIRVVVATNAFGMGVDKPDIKYVIHYHFPGDIESFYQEAGRAGRKDQIVAYSIVLYLRRDRRIQEYFIKTSVPSPQMLAALYQFLRQRAGDTLFLGDDDLADALPFEEHALRIGVHILEREGYVRRGYDFAARCAIKLFDPVADVLARIKEPERQQKLATLLQTLKLIDYGEKRGVNLAQLCQQTGLNPDETELFLIELNRAEVLSFRAWERGYTLYKQPRMAHTEYLELDTPALLAQVQNARHKLDRMIRDYIETPNCRRTAVLRYFGEVPAHDRCHKCDRCGLPEAVPWSQTFDVDLPDLFTTYHPGYVAIEAASHYHGQYGRTRVIQTLIGQSFSPFDQKALPRALMDSEYFKALRGHKYEEVRDFFVLLESEGYITRVHKEINNKPLPMIGVTKKGLDALENGDVRALPTMS